MRVRNFYVTPKTVFLRSDTAATIFDYQELLSYYVAQNNELQVRGPNVSIRGSSSVKLQEPQ